MQLSATRRGARLARLLAAEHLRALGLPCEPAELVVAELAANAALHGRVPGRDFLLRLTVTEATVRIEVTDSRYEAMPAAGSRNADGVGVAESGRGLLIVDALADRWGVIARRSEPRKTVWAELTAKA